MTTTPTPNRTRSLLMLVAAAALLLGGCTAVPADDGAPPDPDTTVSASPDAVSDDDDAPPAGQNDDADGGQDAPADDVDADEPAPDAGADEPAAPAIQLAMYNQRCISGRLTVTVTANYDNSYRKGIQSVVLERQNEYDVWLDADARWLDDAGQRDQWTGQPPGSKVMRFGDTVRVTARASGGVTETAVYPITVNC